MSNLLEICANIDGDDSALTVALMDAFNFTQTQASVVQSMQVRRFRPLGVARIRSHLAELDDLLGNAV
jgi:DNA gyrase/topoisomerase IV subunit A